MSGQSSVSFLHDKRNFLLPRCKPQLVRLDINQSAMLRLNAGIYTESPVWYRKPQYHCLPPCQSLLTSSRPGEEVGDRDREIRHNGSRRKKMDSRESRSPSELQKSSYCYVHRAKMAAIGVQRGNGRR
ncbi:hypothetical protein NQZ68_000164 [Dissostichus eleginoides]|nr:hypothetical protein NQZ68_000164 [Dissostichus eleginoides]